MKASNLNLTPLVAVTVALFLALSVPVLATHENTGTEDSARDATTSADNRGTTGAGEDDNDDVTTGASDGEDDDTTSVRSRERDKITTGAADDDGTSESADFEDQTIEEFSEGDALRCVVEDSNVGALMLRCSTAGGVQTGAAVDDDEQTQTARRTSTDAAGSMLRCTVVKSGLGVYTLQCDEETETVTTGSAADDRITRRSGGTPDDDMTSSAQRDDRSTDTTGSGIDEEMTPTSDDTADQEMTTTGTAAENTESGSRWSWLNPRNWGRNG